jgi:hypothetical protein
VWSRGKDGGYIKVLPIAIKLTGRLAQEETALFEALMGWSKKILRN